MENSYFSPLLVYIYAVISYPITSGNSIILHKLYLFLFRREICKGWVLYIHKRKGFVRQKNNFHYIACNTILIKKKKEKKKLGITIFIINRCSLYAKCNNPKFRECPSKVQLRSMVDALFVIRTFNFLVTRLFEMCPIWFWI